MRDARRERIPAEPQEGLQIRLRTGEGMTMARRFARGAQFQVCGIMNWLVLALEHMSFFRKISKKEKEQLEERNKESI